jgi:hypothetical protein
MTLMKAEGTIYEKDYLVHEVKNKLGETYFLLTYMENESNRKSSIGKSILFSAEYSVLWSSLFRPRAPSEKEKHFRCLDVSLSPSETMREAIILRDSLALFRREEIR